MKKSGTYYNEHNKFSAQWLRNLIKAGILPDGDVDERSIEDVVPTEIARYKQCHFFAGIGIWPYALRSAGWPDDEEVWTGSCPCQPFSTNGKKQGFDDERHLWPAWNHLILVGRPKRIYGEQVASEDGLAWLDLVQADLEAQGYAFGATDLCSAGFGAPHVRQRLHFMADSDRKGLQRRLAVLKRGLERNLGPCRVVDGLDNHSMSKLLGGKGKSTPREANGFWKSADWIRGQDGRFRPVERGTFPLADGDSARVGKISAYGNALNVEVASAFVEITKDL